MLSNHLILCHPLLLLPSMRLKSLSWRIPNLYFLSLWVSAWVSGFQSGASGKEPTCQCRRLKRCGFDLWVRKISWRRKWQPTSVFLPRQFHGQMNWMGYSSWVHKESDMTERLSTHIIILNGERLNALYLRSGTRQPCLFSPLIISIVLKVYLVQHGKKMK